MKVYLSSTLNDLRQERDAVKAVLGGECIVRESYNAHESDLRDSCIADVADCEVYIGVVGLRYGFVPPREQKSITHLEFDAATMHGLDRLIFIKDEAAIAVPSTDADAPGGMAKIREFRAELQSGRDNGIRPAIFSTIEELRETALKTLHELRRRREAREAQAAEKPPAGRREERQYDSVTRLQEGLRDSLDRCFRATRLERRVMVRRPDAELWLHEEMLNISDTPQNELVRILASDSPVEFSDFEARARLTIGDRSFDAAVTPIDYRNDGRSFKVRIGFKGRPVPPGTSFSLDWYSRSPASVARNNDYWAFPCLHEQPVEELICEVAFPQEVADYAFYRIVPGPGGTPEYVAVPVDGPIPEIDAEGTPIQVYRAQQSRTAFSYMMTWRYA